MSNIFRIFICITLLVTVAYTACPTNCKTTAPAAGTACTTVGGVDTCNECASGDFWLKTDAANGNPCIAGTVCGVAGQAEAALFQATDGGKKLCATGTECNAFTTPQYTIASVAAAAGPPVVTAVTGVCVLPAACTSAGKYIDATKAAGSRDCIATCPNTLYVKDDTVKRCVDLAGCSTDPVAPDTVNWYAKEDIAAAAAVVTNGVTCSAAVTAVPKQCITAAACNALTGYYRETVTGAKKCRPCPSTCNSVAGSCKDTTSAAATSSCWQCNTVVAPCAVAGTQATSILKDDGTCITPDTCTGTNPAGLTTQTGSQYYSDTSNGLQPKCNSCPSTCNANTVVAGAAAAGTCAYGSASTGTCLNCDTDAPYLKDGSTPSSPKICVADGSTGNCPKTNSNTAITDPQLYAVDDTNKKCTIVTSSSVSSASISATTFNSTPNVVVSPGTNSTDNNAWNIPAAYVKFGAGLTNGTIYAYGIKLASSGGISTIAGVVTRTINATTVSNGTDSNEASVISGGSLVSVSWPSLAVTSAGGSDYRILTAAVAGYYIVAYSGYEAQWTNNLYAYAWGTAGSSTSGKVQLTSIASPTGGTSNYQYQASNIWLEDNIVYVAFVQKKVTYSSSGSGASIILGVNPGSAVDVGAYVGGFNPATGALFYNDTSGKSSPAKVYVSDANTQPMGLVCGPSNYTNSTTINCLYNAGTDTATAKYNTYYVSLTRSTGSAGSAASIASSSGYGTTYPMTSVQFFPAGIVTGAYASGGLFYAKNTSIAAATTLSCAYSYSYGLYWWNTTSGSGVWSSPGLTAAGATGAGGSVTAWGGTLGTGYYIATAVDTSSTSYSATCVSGGTTNSITYQFASFYANGTANGSTVTLGSLESGNGQYFVDKNGTLWFGYTTQEKSRASTSSPSVSQGNLYSGSVGKFQGQLFINTFGNVLSTFFAFLSLILFGLFAF